MTQVLPLQLNKIDNLEKLSLFVDAIQNPVRYVKIIDDALEMLQKLKVVVEKTVIVDNANAYLDLAKDELKRVTTKAEQDKQIFASQQTVILADLKLQNGKLISSQETLAKEKSELEKQAKALSEEQQVLARRISMVGSQQQTLEVKEKELATRELDLKKRSEALKELVG